MRLNHCCVWMLDDLTVFELGEVIDFESSDNVASYALMPKSYPYFMSTVLRYFIRCYC